MEIAFLIAAAAAGLYLLKKTGSTTSAAPAPAAPTTSAGDLLRQAFSVKPVSASTAAPLTTAAPAPAPAPATTWRPSSMENNDEQPVLAPAPAAAPAQPTAYDRALANPASIPRLFGETQEQAVARVSGWANDQRARITGSNELRTAYNTTAQPADQMPLRKFP